MSGNVTEFPEPNRRLHPQTQADMKSMSADLSDLLGLPVEISGSGVRLSVTIRSEDLDQFDRLCVILQAGVRAAP